MADAGRNARNERAVRRDRSAARRRPYNGEYHRPPRHREADSPRERFQRIMDRIDRSAANADAAAWAVEPPGANEVPAAPFEYGFGEQPPPPVPARPPGIIFPRSRRNPRADYDLVVRGPPALAQGNRPQYMFNPAVHRDPLRLDPASLWLNFMNEHPQPRHQEPLFPADPAPLGLAPVAEDPIAEDPVAADPVVDVRAAAEENAVEENVAAPEEIAPVAEAVLVEQRMEVQEGQVADAPAAPAPEPQAAPAAPAPEAPIAPMAQNAPPAPPPPPPLPVAHAPRLRAAAAAADPAVDLNRAFYNRLLHQQMMNDNFPPGINNILPPIGNLLPPPAARPARAPPIHVAPLFGAPAPREEPIPDAEANDRPLRRCRSPPGLPPLINTPRDYPNTRPFYCFPGLVDLPIRNPKTGRLLHAPTLPPAGEIGPENRAVMRAFGDWRELESKRFLRTCYYANLVTQECTWTKPDELAAYDYEAARQANESDYLGLTSESEQPSAADVLPAAVRGRAGRLGALAAAAAAAAVGAPQRHHHGPPPIYVPQRRARMNPPGGGY